MGCGVCGVVMWHRVRLNGVGTGVGCSKGVFESGGGEGLPTSEGLGLGPGVGYGWGYMREGCLGWLQYQGGEGGTREGDGVPGRRRGHYGGSTRDREGGGVPGRGRGSQGERRSTREEGTRER